MDTKIYCSYPTAQFLAHKDEILSAIAAVCSSSSYVLGPQVANFEQEFAKFNAVKYAIGVGSGTDALILAMKAYDIGPGDEVITVSHTAVATVSAILLAGATPVLIDVDEDFYTIEPERILEAITPKTKAIIPVHLYGQPCDMNPILDIAKAHNLYVIEDCAQAHAATYREQKVGSLGHAGCFSFYPTKNLGGIGDGGAVISNNETFIDRIKRLRQYGWNQFRVSEELGMVSRLDEIQAAILNTKLKYLNEANRRRNEIAKFYNDNLKFCADITLPKIRSECTHAYHLYVIAFEQRDKLLDLFREHGVVLGIHYSISAHEHPGIRKRVILPKEGLPNTERLTKRILSLPMYPELKSENLQMVVNVMRDFR